MSDQYGVCSECGMELPLVFVKRLGQDGMGQPLVFGHGDSAGDCRGGYRPPLRVLDASDAQPEEMTIRNLAKERTDLKMQVGQLELMLANRDETIQDYKHQIDELKKLYGSTAQRWLQSERERKDALALVAKLSGQVSSLESACGDYSREITELIAIQKQTADRVVSAERDRDGALADRDDAVRIRRIFRAGFLSERERALRAEGDLADLRRRLDGHPVDTDKPCLCGKCGHSSEMYCDGCVCCYWRKVKGED